MIDRLSHSLIFVAMHVDLQAFVVAKVVFSSIVREERGTFPMCRTSLSHLSPSMEDSNLMVHTGTVTDDEVSTHCCLHS